MQFGYTFKNAAGLPLSTLYAGFDTLKYNTGIGSPFAPSDSTSGTLPGYSEHAGVEFQPAPNVSLSLGFGYTQQSGRIDSDINSLVAARRFSVCRQRSPLTRAFQAVIDEVPSTETLSVLHSGD